MLRAQIGQSVVFKTPTKLQHPYCNSFEAITIGKLDFVLDRRNVTLFRDLATEPIFTPRISRPPIHVNKGNYQLSSGRLSVATDYNAHVANLYRRDDH